jgi:hypothetical protein
MKENDKISNKNGNWYIAEIIEKCEPIKRNNESESRRVITYGNHHLIKADNPKEAYNKAVKIGKESEFKFINANKIEMEWIFVGIGDLFPIYEDTIEDGAEIMWTDYGVISNKRTMQFSRTEKELLKNCKPKKK